MAVNTEPAWYQKWLKKNDQNPNKPILSTNPQQNSITLTCGTGEMLKVSEDGFYVRGKKLAVDDNEALAVYNAFSEWLNWQILNRDQK